MFLRGFVRGCPRLVCARDCVRAFVIASAVGSIGVIFQNPNVTQLLGTLGVKMEIIKSSPLKASPRG